MKYFFYSLVLFLSVEQVLADTILITPGRSEADSVFDIDGGDRIRVYLYQNKSYACSITQKDIDSNDKFITFDLEAGDPDSEQITVSGIGNYDPVIAAPSGVSSLKSRISLIATKTGFYTFSPVISDPTDIATIRCVETTLYGGYNRFAADIPIVELTNLSSENISPRIRVTDLEGEEVFTNEGSEVEIAPFGRQDIPIGGLTENTYGVITVTYLGPFGAIKGIVAEYNAASDGGFDLQRERKMEAPAIIP